MPLSNEERQALLEKAAGLRAELSSQAARREDAVAVASQNLEDQRLIAEVESLAVQVDAATESADKAEVAANVKDAAEIMRQAAARQAEAVQETDPTGSSPATPATDNTTPDPELQGDLLSADLTVADETGKEGSK